ncbi:Uncharacterised protein [Mycobacteroides abscessus subsp. abscessus]|nr:Uncharacterised protein [Mycobacteroides abscessus subsp. abscessus]
MASVRSSLPSMIASSAPTVLSQSSRSALRPATVTCPAPNTDFANCTASEPVTPVAPSTSTCWPGCTAAPWARASQADIPGLGIAAAVTESTCSGTSTAPAGYTTVRSAIIP